MPSIIVTQLLKVDILIMPVVLEGLGIMVMKMKNKFQNTMYQVQGLIFVLMDGISLSELLISFLWFFLEMYCKLFLTTEINMLCLEREQASLICHKKMAKTYKSQLR